MEYDETPMDWKRNPTLIIGIAIPVLMILFVAASIYLPAFFATPPRYNFLYLTGDSYDYQWQYRVSGGKLEEIPRNVAKNAIVPGRATLYLFDITKKESTTITAAEAKKLNLDPSGVAPDGYEVVRGNGGGFFPFDFRDNSYSTFYLRNRFAGQKITLKTSEGNYWNYEFLGWVLP